jgi:hypothetical protein
VADPEVGLGAELRELCNSHRLADLVGLYLWSRSPAALRRPSNRIAGRALPITKKADVIEHPKVRHHVGLLFN